MGIDFAGEFKEVLRAVLKEELAPIHKRLDTLEQDVQEIKARQQRHEEMIQQLIQIVGDTNAKVDALDKRIRLLDEKIQTLDEKVQALDEKVQMLDEKVQALDEKVQALDERTLSLIESAKNMENKLDHFDRILDVLSRRSIEQEAKLKRIIS